MSVVGQNEIVFKQGDNHPPLGFSLFQSNDMPVDLTGAEVTFWARRVNGRTPVVEGAIVDVLDAINGRAAYDWVGFTSEHVGVFEAEIRVEYIGGTRFTVPDDGYLVINILDDIEWDSNDSDFPQT
jgi:hypothetical protein